MLIAIDRDGIIVNSVMNARMRKSEEVDDVQGRMVELNHSNRTYAKNRID